MTGQPMLELDLFLDRHGIDFFSAQEIVQLGRRYRGEVITMPPRDLWPNIVPTLQVLDRVREHAGPIRVYSGYRPKAYNEVVGGASRSLHVQFNAIDSFPVDAEAWTPDDYAEVIREAGEGIIAGWCGFGVYQDPHPNNDRQQGFVHLDTRSLVLGLPPAHWTG